MEDTIEKRERILQAAADQLVDVGLQFYMNVVAKQARVAVGSLYNYYGSKRALIEGVYARVAQEMAEAMVVDFEPDVGPEARIKHYIKSYIGFALADARRIHLFDYLDNSPELDIKAITAIFEPMTVYTIDLIESGQRDGSIREGSAYLLGASIRGMARHVIKRRRGKDPSPVTPEEAHWIGELCWSAVAKPKC